MAKDIKCTCGHSWSKSSSSKKDMHVCHICGKDNTMEDGGWLSKYEQGGMVLKQQANDNYGEKPNPNDVQASVGPGFVGLGYNTKGRNYSPAWGGQFAMGGSLPGAVGFTYARTQNPAPSNGKYAKKTKASAQDGKTLKNIKGESENFLKGWMNSPMYNKMINNSINTSSNQQEEVLKAMSREDQLKKMSWNYSDLDADKSLLDKFMGQTTFGQFNPSNNKISLNPTVNTNKLYETGVHEGSHATDLGGANIPSSDVEKMWKYRKEYAKQKGFFTKLFDDEDYNTYVGRPTETRARLNSIRYIGKKKGIYDPYTEKVNKDILKKLPSSILKPTQLDQLRLIYSDDQIIDLLNSVSESNSNRPISQAQNGKEMKYYQEGLDFKPKTISQNGLLMSFEPEKMRSDATRVAAPIRPLTKEQQKENVRINKQTQKNTEEYNKALLADRKSRRETKGDVNVPGSFNIAEKLRFAPNSPGGWGQVFDEYVNPAFVVGTLADALGESIAAKDPKAVAATLAMTAGLGALGFDPLGDAMKLQRFSRGAFNNLGYRPQAASFGDPFKGGDNYFGGIGNLDDAAVAQQQQALVNSRQAALSQSSQSSRVPYQFPTDEELLAMNLREAERYAPRASRLGRQRMATPDDMTSLNRSTALDPIEEYYQRNPRPVTQRMPDEEELVAVRNQDDILRTIRNRIDARQSQQIIPAPPPEIRVPTQSRGYEITDADLVDLISEDDLVDRSMYNAQPTSQPTLSAGPKFGEEDFKIGRANPGRGEVIDATGNKFTQDVIDYSPNERAGTYQITGPDGGFMQVNTRINPNDPDAYLNVTNMTFRSEDEKIASRQLQKIFSNLPNKVDMGYISTSMYSQPITDAQVTRWANDKRLTESFRDIYPAGRIELRDVDLGLLNSWHKDKYDAVFNNRTGELYGDYLTQLKRQFPKLQRTAKNVSEATGTPLPEPEMRIYDPMIGSQIKLTMDDLNSSFWKNRFDENPYLRNNVEIYAPKYKFKKNWKNGGQIVDSMGQWAHPGEVTTIPSNDITMKGVNYDVLGISNTGDKKLMKPGKNYKFDGDYVTEYPKGGWLDKYK